MRLSVITAVYNCLAHTQAMVASLARSLPPDLDWELVLVDDGSTDGTREWLASQAATSLSLRPPSRIHVLLQATNTGFAAANNRGAASVSGEILALLNNDLVLAPGWFEPMLSTLESRPDAALVGNVQTAVSTRAVHHTGIFINARGKPEHDRDRPSSSDPVRPVTAATAACALIRRDVFTRLGGFDEAFRNGHEDVDLCLRARTAGLRSYVATASSVEHHVSASPGRSRLKIANAARSMNRWRDVLPTLAGEAWRDPHLRTRWERKLPWPDRLRAFAARPRLSGTSPVPPSWLTASVRRSIDRQLARWRRELGGALPG